LQRSNWFGRLSLLSAALSPCPATLPEVKSFRVAECGPRQHWRIALDLVERQAVGKSSRGGRFKHCSLGSWLVVCMPISDSQRTSHLSPLAPLQFQLETLPQPRRKHKPNVENTLKNQRQPTLPNMWWVTVFPTMGRSGKNQRLTSIFA
jgi:hypothetical protein